MAVSALGATTAASSDTLATIRSADFLSRRLAKQFEDFENLTAETKAEPICALPDRSDNRAWASSGTPFSIGKDGVGVEHILVDRESSRRCLSALNSTPMKGRQLRLGLREPATDEAAMYYLDIKDFALDDCSPGRNLASGQPSHFGIGPQWVFPTVTTSAWNSL